MALKISLLTNLPGEANVWLTVNGSQDREKHQGGSSVGLNSGTQLAAIDDDYRVKWRPRV